ncbi:MAG: patatin-like phospholipase family protein [Actinomycetota bacterium]
MAFVLGGGGHMGAHEVGMLAALLDHGISPDLIVGASVGALNGAAIAAEPATSTVDTLKDVWLRLGKERVFASPLGGAGNLIRKGTHLHSNGPLRALIERTLPVETFEALKVPFQCVAASIERAAEHWFSEGSLADAILASAAVPGILPPVEIGGEHFIDGGIVNSIPIERAVQLGGSDLYILHVGRIERPLRPPKNLLQVAMVAFEIARRHRFAHDMATLPPEVVAHVLPTGEEETSSSDGISQLRYRDLARVAERIARAHRATKDYLEQVSTPGDG